MPPKQKMGSITHNSAEVNRGSSKGGMFSKLKGSFTSSRPGPASKSNSKKHLLQHPPKSVNSSSLTLGSSQQHSTVKCHASSSFTQASSSVTSTDNRGVPTSITALVDAPSVLTDEVIETGPTHHPPQEFCPPQARARRRPSMRSYGTTDAASRALGNLNVGGAPKENSQVPIPRNDLGEWGNHPGEPGQDPGREWGGRHFSHDEMAEVNNTGYSNTRDHGYDGYYDGGNGRDYYDGRGGEMGRDGGDYYDESGGGIFDNSYMRQSGIRRTSVSAHQPPPPNRGYNRSFTSAQRPQNRRASDESQATHDTYMTAPANLGVAPYRRPTQEESSRSNQQSYHHQTEQTDPSMGYRNPPSGRYGNKAPHESARNSAGNPRRRVSSDPHKIPPEPGRNSADNQPRRKNSGETGHNPGHTQARHNIVNNTGRDSGISPTSSVKLSASGRTGSERNNNPSWFTEQHSDSTDNIQNKNKYKLHNISSRSCRYQADDDDRTMTTMATKDQALRPSAMLRAKEKNNPTGDVTIIFTDVQGSTSFWETCPNDMKKATDIHDTLIRQCYTNHSGYEISTEGDSFNLAFQHPVDALAFALQAQLKLYKADWPDGILNHPDGKDEPALKFRGFRVRFGIHHGPTKSRVHEMTGRNVYSGEGAEVAKAVEGMCHGGQILTTMETWKAVSGMAERYLGRPQVSDCGEHLLFESKTPNGSSGYTTTRYTRRIMQLVPSNLAFDYFEARGRQEVSTGIEIKNASSVSGRLFPPLKSKKQLSTCFLNAPYANGRVTICFVYTVGLDDVPDNRTKNLGILAKLIRKKMLSLDPPGYECQEDNGCWMLAFDRMANAVTFGLDVKSAGTEAKDLAGTVDREAMFKVGILSGAFTSMGPHKTTGMADYFGPIVNRASRVASNCEPGKVCVGIPLSNGVAADPPDFGPTIRVQLEGIKKLKGITIDMAIFTCTKRRIETPYK